MPLLESGYYYVYYIPEFDEPSGVLEIVEYDEEVWHRIGSDELYTDENFKVVEKVRPCQQ